VALLKAALLKAAVAQELLKEELLKAAVVQQLLKEELLKAAVVQQLLKEELLKAAVVQQLLALLHEAVPSVASRRSLLCRWRRPRRWLLLMCCDDWSTCSWGVVASKAQARAKPLPVSSGLSLSVSDGRASMGVARAKAGRSLGAPLH